MGTLNLYRLYIILSALSLMLIIFCFVVLISFSHKSQNLTDFSFRDDSEVNASMGENIDLQERLLNLLNSSEDQLRKYIILQSSNEPPLETEVNELTTENLSVLQQSSTVSEINNPTETLKPNLENFQQNIPQWEQFVSIINSLNDRINGTLRQNGLTNMDLTFNPYRWLSMEPKGFWNTKEESHKTEVPKWLHLVLNVANSWIYNCSEDQTPDDDGLFEPDQDTYIPYDDKSFNQTNFIYLGLSPLGVLGHFLQVFLIFTFLVGVVLLLMIVVLFAKVKETHSYSYLKDRFQKTFGTIKTPAPPSTPILYLETPDSSSCSSLRTMIKNTTSLLENPDAD